MIKYFHRMIMHSYYKKKGEPFYEQALRIETQVLFKFLIFINFTIMQYVVHSTKHVEKQQ